MICTGNSSARYVQVIHQLDMYR